MDEERLFKDLGAMQATLTAIERNGRETRARVIQLEKDVSEIKTQHAVERKIHRVYLASAAAIIAVTAWFVDLKRLFS